MPSNFLFPQTLLWNFGADAEDPKTKFGLIVHSVMALWWSMDQ